MNAELIGKAVARGLAAVCLAVGVVAVTAQETNEQVRIDFRNKIPGIVDAPVYDFDGATGLETTRFRAGLYVGNDTNAFEPVGTVYPFLTGTNAGYWQHDAPIEIVPFPGAGLGLGSQIWIQVRIAEIVNTFPFPTGIWVGHSKPWSMVITNYVMPMVGLESFKLEPERLEITVNADQSIIQWQYLAAARYELQSTSDLRPPVSWAPIFEWSGIAENWQIFSVTNTLTAIPQFYRLERWR
jgi:hypothetical protein